MSKQAISVTLSPENLVWLRGRTRASQLASLSECLDRLITRARFGQDTPRPVRSMKGALVGIVPEPVDAQAAVPVGTWSAWRANWDAMLEGLDTTRMPAAQAGSAPLRAPKPKPAAAARPASVRGRHRA